MTSRPLSQGNPCPQLFEKRHQTSIGKDACKDLLAGREEEIGGRWKEKEKKEKAKKTRHDSLKK
jgi:hypothetical protein